MKVPTNLTMALRNCALLFCFIVGVQSLEDSDLKELIDRKFEALTERIKGLEAMNHDNRIEMANMEARFAQREQDLLDKLARLENEYISASRTKELGAVEELDTTHDTEHAEIDRGGAKENDVGKAHAIASEDHQSSFFKNASRRATTPPHIAFFAIGPNFDFANMATGQALTYATPTTNIGNAFNHASGEFVAPVKGTYVLFVTVCAKLTATNHFNVEHNGAILAKLFVGDIIEQSSQAVVVSLLPGDEVAVRSGGDHNGAYGKHYTTIAGFLLF